MDLTVMTKEQLDEILVQLKAGKTQLEASKKSDGKSWTKENQDKLQECISTIVDVEEQLETLSSKEKVPEDKNSDKEGYQPLKGEEKLVVAELVHGKRFDPNTGEEISQKYNQKFTEGEWRNFEKNAKQLGYSFTVLYNPFKK